MKIGIIGLGLIGGSLFKDLSEDFDVIAVSNSQSGQNIYKTFDVLKDRDLIFVCSPMNKTLKILDDLEEIIPADVTVTDVCSLKQFVCKKKYVYNFVPSHPMAGTENKGFENSLKGLFKDAKWVITGGENTEKLLDVIKFLGAKPIFTTPEKHDETAALISHMPMVLAQALMLTIKDNPLAKEMAASGFKDMTRLALSNKEMACDMVYLNHKNIEQAILKLYKSIGELTSEKYPKIINELKNIRKNMYQ